MRVVLLTEVGTPGYNCHMTTRLIRTVIYLDKKAHAALDKLSEETGASRTELMRRAIAEYLTKRKKG